MLHALKDQLTQLAKEDQDRFLTSLRKKARIKTVRQHAEPLKNFILVMPEMIRQISVWSQREDLPAEVRQLHGYVLTYLYHPVDFLHDEGYGLFGYLDDAYLVGLAYQATLRQMKEPPRFLPNQADVNAQLDGWLNSVSEVLPRESAQVRRIVQDLLEGKRQSFQEVFK